MAAIARGFRRYLQSGRSVSLTIPERGYHRTQVQQKIYKASHVARRVDQNDTKYEYIVSSDPKEWEMVEKLIGPRTVPPVLPKNVYPSGWRPPTEEALTHPYYVERTKNHMLPVYLKNYHRGLAKQTHVKNIRGDIWKMYDELHEYLAKETKKKRIFSYVHEGDCRIVFKGDVVYYVEQWMLSKGF